MPGVDHTILDYSDLYTHIVLQVTHRNADKVHWDIDGVKIGDLYAMTAFGVHCHAYQDVFVGVHQKGFKPKGEKQHTITAKCGDEAICWQITVK